MVIGIYKIIFIRSYESFCYSVMKRKNRLDAFVKTVPYKPVGLYKLAT